VRSAAPSFPLGRQILIVVAGHDVLRTPAGRDLDRPETATAVRDAYAAVGLPLIDVPPGLDLPARVGWIAGRVDPLLPTLSG
jgi:hypothetical protein